MVYRDRCATSYHARSGMCILSSKIYKTAPYIQGMFFDIAAHCALHSITFLLHGICFMIDIVRSAYWRYVCGDPPEDNLPSFPPPQKCTLPSTEMSLVGHRGASIAAPENTMAAFRTAFKQCGAIEFDLRCTLDGVVVVSHDNTLKRQGSIVVKPQSAAAAAAPSTLGEQAGLLYTPINRLQYSSFADSVEVGSKSHGVHVAGEMVPTFTDVLREFGKSSGGGGGGGSSSSSKDSDGTKVSRSRSRTGPRAPVHRVTRPLFYVELKGGDFTLAKNATLIATAVAPNADMYRWIGFNLPLMVEVKRLLPRHKVYHIGAILPFFGCEAKAMRLIDQAAGAGLDGIDLNADETVLTPRVVAYAHRKGLDVVAWVYSGQRESPRLYTALAAAGVDALTSNLPPPLKAWQELRRGAGES